MNMHDYLQKARRDDALRAGEQDRLLLEARHARGPRRRRAGPAGSARRLTRLVFRRATA